MKRYGKLLAALACLLAVETGQLSAFADDDVALRSPTYVLTPDERLLQEKNVGVSTEQLWKFLEIPDLPPWTTTFEEFLRHFDKRAAYDPKVTMRRLMARGMKRFDYDDVNRDNPEFVRELKRVLAAEHAKSTPRVVEAAIRLLHHRKPPEFVKKLIRLSPSLVSLDERIRYTLVDSLTAMAQQNEDAATELIAATRLPTDIVRALATRSLVRAGQIEPAAAAALCENENPIVRWQIAMGLVDCHAKAAIPVLIELIPDVQAEQAAHLQRLLRHIGGKGPVLQRSSDEQSRAAVRDAWLEWWSANADNVTDDQVSHGYTLLYSGTHVGEVDLSGNFVWWTEIRGPVDMKGKLYTNPSSASMLPNGNILLGESWRQWQARRRVYEFTRTGHAVWVRDASARSIEGLKDGRALICTTYQLFIYGPEKRVLRPSERNNNFIMAKAKPEGGYAVIGFGPRDNDGQGCGELIEFDSSGAVTRTTRLPEKPNDSASWAFDCLPNGHMLVSRNKKVLELNAERKIVRTFARIAFTPSRMQRLASGNILFANDDDLLEYSPSGEKLNQTEFPNRRVFVSRR